MIILGFHDYFSHFDEDMNDECSILVLDTLKSSANVLPFPAS